MNLRPQLTDFAPTPSPHRVGVLWSQGHAYLDVGILDPVLRGLLLPIRGWSR